jgi:hypothetical protein
MTNPGTPRREETTERQSDLTDKEPSACQPDRVLIESELANRDS